MARWSYFSVRFIGLLWDGVPMCKSIVKAGFTPSIF